MKSLLLLPIFALLHVVAALAQPQFAPLGAEWWYGFKGGFLYQQGWNHFVYEKDTMVAGKVCKKLIQNNYSRSNDTSAYYLAKYHRFLYQQGDSVFLYVDPLWLLRWRTNPVAGNTYEIQKYSWSQAYTLTIKVDSTKTINLGGKLVKKIWQTGTENFGIGGSVVIYDKIGPDYADFDYIRCWGALDCYPPSLCKYKDNQFPLYEFSSPVCDLITATQNPVWQGVLPVSPNPCYDVLYFDVSQLEATDLTLAVFNQAGQLLKVLNLSAASSVELSTGDLPSGVYLYRLTGKRSVYSGRFVKM